MTRIYRSETDVVIAGVLGGIGELLHIDATILRLVFVAATIFTGIFPLVVAYLVAWLIVPRKSQVPSESAGSGPAAGSPSDSTVHTHEEI